MRRLLFVLLLAAIAACSNSDVTTADPLGAPLITDAELDAAPLMGETESQTLDASPLSGEDSSGEGNFEAQSFAQAASEVPLDDRSTLALIEKKGRTYRIILRETRPSGRGGGYRKTLAYSSEREVTSVSVSSDGQFLFFTAAAKDGNIEGYAFDRDGSRLGQKGLVRLTDTEADEADASMSLDGSTFVWASGDALAVGTLEPRLSVTVFPLVFEEREVILSDPSLSGNGGVVVFVVDGESLGSEADVVGAFDTTSVELARLYEGDARDPSLSFGADYLLFAEGDVVRHLDLASGEVADLLTDTAVTHPYLTSDGLYFTYGRDGDVYTRPVNVRNPEDAPEDLLEQSASQPYWAKTTFTLEYSATNIGGANFVRPDANAGFTDEQRTVGYHTYSFVAPVSDRYQILSEQDYDGYLLLYEGFFNPQRPEVNLLAESDEIDVRSDSEDRPVGLSRVSSELKAGQRYIVVTAACGSECGPPTGRFTNTITRNAPPPLPPFVLPEPDNDGFDITLRFVSEVTDEQRAVFERAAERWSAIITEDLTDIENFRLEEGFLFADVAPVEGTLDDLLIDVVITGVDGGPLAGASPLFLREGTEDAPLPSYGYMRFDAKQFAEGGQLENEQLLEDVIVHEMGHVLGIGSVWELTGNTQGVINPGDPDFPGGPPTVPLGQFNPDYDPRFTGPLAVKEYQTLLERAGRDLEDTVPIANTGGPSAYNGHWRELVFSQELMSPTISNEPSFLSRMTAASLGDIGYTVNINAEAVDQNYALLPASFAQLAPTDVTYQEFVDFFKFDGSQGSVEARVGAVDLALGEGNTSTSGCEPEDFAGFKAGNIALVQRGECSYGDKIANAEAAGAVGVIIMNQGDTADRTDVLQGLIDETFPIPAVSISYDLGVELAKLAAEGTLEVAIDVPVPDAGIQTLGAAGSLPEFKEEVHGPIGTISPNGKINLFDD